MVGRDRREGVREGMKTFLVAMGLKAMKGSHSSLYSSFLPSSPPSFPPPSPQDITRIFIYLLRILASENGRE